MIYWPSPTVDPADPRHNRSGGRLHERFGAHPKLHYANLGRTVNLREPALAYDGMHLTSAGNARIADDLVEPLLRIID